MTESSKQELEQLAERLNLAAGQMADLCERLDHFALYWPEMHRSTIDLTNRFKPEPLQPVRKMCNPEAGP